MSDVPCMYVKIGPQMLPDFIQQRINRSKGRRTSEKTIPRLREGLNFSQVFKGFFCAANCLFFLVGKWANCLMVQRLYIFDSFQSCQKKIISRVSAAFLWQLFLSLCQKFLPSLYFGVLCQKLLHNIGTYAKTKHTTKVVGQVIKNRKISPRPRLCV